MGAHSACDLLGADLLERGPPMEGGPECSQNYVAFNIRATYGSPKSLIVYQDILLQKVRRKRTYPIPDMP